VTGLGTVLGVWAHPDDEAYLMAGTAMSAIAAGSRVACVTATAGEAGETADETRWPRADLDRIRRRELAASLEIVGIDEHRWLDLADGSLDGVAPERGVDLVATILDEVRPDTVLTFGPDGMTGHPDHVAIGAWTAAAVERLDRGTLVLAATNTRSWYEAWPELTAAVFPNGGPCVDPEDLALSVELPPDLLERKVAALLAQPSQTSGIVEAIGATAYASWVATECWRERAG
jgi:LmbE family N-acetylglucosaminyl deacetylase